MSKVFLIFGFLLIAGIITLGIVFQNAIFMGVDNESQWQHPGATIYTYEQTAAWDYILAGLLIIIAIAALVYLFI